MQKHRIFLAVQIPKKLKNFLEDYLIEKLSYKSCHGKICKIVYTDKNSKNLISFMPKENWHITVSFLGYLSDEEIEILKNIIEEETAKNISFALKPEKIIWAPHGATKRMVWLEFEKSPEFEKLKSGIEDKII